MPPEKRAELQETRRQNQLLERIIERQDLQQDPSAELLATPKQLV